MLSRATYAGRICLPCRYQLRLTRLRPLPATTRFPRLAVPQYSTTANDDGSSNRPKPSQAEAGENGETTGEDGPSPARQASEPVAESDPSPEGKPVEPSAETAPKSEASSGESLPNKSPSKSVEVEIDNSTVPLSSLPWDLEIASRRLDSRSPSKPRRRDSYPSSKPRRFDSYSDSQPAERGPKRQRGPHGLDIETANLGMNILGKEGHTIVLRDREAQPKKPDTLEEEAPAKRFDIGGSLEEQNRDLTAEETRRNIEELRPSDSRDLVEREFKKIRDTLMDGFTINQLENYVCYFMERTEGKSGSMTEPQQRHLLKRLTGQHRAELRWPVPPRHGWIRQQLSWKPPKHYPWGNTMKEKLVLAIMRTCWHLHIVEEARYIGQVNATVDPSILNLLLLEDKSLQSVQSSLGRGGSIRIVPEKGMMQITASRSKCDAALDQMDGFVSAITESSIPLSDLGPGKLPDGILERLSSLTGASITYDGARASAAPSEGRNAVAKATQENSDSVRIAWLKSNSRPDSVESLRHVIFRLLFSAKCPRNGNEALKTIIDADVPVGPKSFVLRREYGDNHELPWNLRDQVWSRLVYPAEPKAKAQKHNATDSHPKVQGSPGAATPAESQPAHDPMRQDVISLSTLRLPITWRSDIPGPTGWTPNLRRTSAVFGRLVHPFLEWKQRATLDYRKPLIPELLTLKPVLPPVAALTKLGADAEDAETTTTLLIHLWPQREGAPRLEFHVDVPEKGGPPQWKETAKKLVAVKYSWAAHVRLPFNPVDIDIRQTLVSEMEPSTLGASEELRTFFENSQLDLSEDLLTPPSLVLPLPPSLLNMEEGKGKAEVGYFFMGLELHTSSTVPFRSNRLSLTSIEAGQQGRRAELALHPPQVDMLETRGRGRQYLNEALRIAQGKYFSWIGARPVETSIEDY